MLYYWFRYLQTGESLNSKKKTRKSVLYYQCLKVPETATLKNQFPHLPNFMEISLKKLILVDLYCLAVGFSKSSFDDAFKEFYEYFRNTGQWRCRLIK